MERFSLFMLLVASVCAIGIYNVGMNSKQKAHWSGVDQCASALVIPNSAGDTMNVWSGAETARENAPV